MNSISIHMKALRPAVFGFFMVAFIATAGLGGVQLAHAQYDGGDFGDSDSYGDFGGGDFGSYDGSYGGGCGDCTAPAAYPDSSTNIYPDTYTNTYPDTYSNVYPDTYTNVYPDTYSNVYPDTYDYSTPSYSYSTPSYSNYSYPSLYSSSYPSVSYATSVVRYPIYNTPASNNTVITNTNTNTNTNINNTNTNTNINTVNTASSYPVYLSSPSYPTYYPSYPSCFLTVSPNAIAFGQAATISWTSSNATSGWILNVGNVGPSGSARVTPAQNMTYTATFYGPNGQSVNCSASVQVGAYNTNPYVTLSAVPYTGLDLGPWGTAMYWGFLVLWCLFAAYLVVVKRIQNTVASRMKAFLFGGAVAHAASSQEHAEQSSHAHVEQVKPTHVSHAHAPVRKQEQVDEFIMSQIHRGLRA